MFSVVQLRGAVATRGHAAVVSGKEILIFGGEAPLDPSASALEPSQLLLLINTDGAPTCQVAVSRGDVPSARAEHSACALTRSSSGARTVFVFGGRLASGAASNQLYSLDIDTLTWTQVSGSFAPSPRWGHSMVSTPDGKLLVYGGINETGTVLDDDFLFDPATSTWTALNSAFKPSTGRYAHSATLVGSKVYYFGGFDSAHEPLTGPRIYDVNTNEWEAASPMMDDASWGLPPARGHHASILINESTLLISGGRNKPFSATNGTTFDDVYVFDTERSSWQHASAAARAAHTLSVAGNRLFMYGGCSGDEAVSEIPIAVAGVEALLSSVATFMHDNKLTEGIQSGDGKPRSRLRALYEHERAQRIKLQARCALLENKLFNRSSAKQLSLELLVKQLREKDLEIAELRRKNELLQQRFQSTATPDDHIREAASDLAILWQRHEEHRRLREEAHAALVASEAALKQQMEKFGTALGEDLFAPLTSRNKSAANNSAILTANLPKRYSHNDAAALARASVDSGEKSEEYAKWLSSFNEKAAADRSAKSDRVSESSSDEVKPIDMGKLSGPSLRPASPRRSESAVSPRLRASSSGTPPEIAVSVPSKEPTSARAAKSDSPISTPPVTPKSESAASMTEDKKKKDKKTLSEQFLAGKATFSRRFSQVTGKAKSLLQSGKEKEDKPALKQQNSSTKLAKKDDDEEGVWQPPATPNSVKPLPLNLDTLDKCLAYLQPHLELDGIFRVSGVAHQVRSVYTKLESGDITGEENPHVVTGALKLYLRELEEPLIPFALYTKTVAAMRSFETSQNLAEVKSVLQTLPDLNREVLNRLVHFLGQIAANSAKNRMDLKNLGIVFGPTLLRPAKETLETMMSDTNIVNLFAATLIEKHDELFEPMAESDKLASSSAGEPAGASISAAELVPEDKKKRRKDKKGQE